MDPPKEKKKKVAIQSEVSDEDYHEYANLDDDLRLSENLARQLSDIDMQSMIWAIPDVCKFKSRFNSVTAKHQMAIQSYVSKVIADATQDHVTDLIHQRYLMRPAHFETFVHPHKYKRLPPAIRLPWLPPAPKYQLANLARDRSLEGASQKLGWPSPLASPLALNNFSACVLRKLYNATEKQLIENR